MESTSELFSDLKSAGHVPQLEKMDGTVRFDIAERTTTDHVLVAIKGGNVTVSEQMSPADCVIHVDRELIDGVARGEVNIMAAVLRGEVRIEGDPRIAVMVQRFFPGPGDKQNKQTSSRNRKSK